MPNDQKALIITPYWDTLGGGEKYIASLAKILLQAGWLVDIPWPESSLFRRIHERFGLAIDQARRIPVDPTAKQFVLTKWLEQRQYDLVIQVSDGSVPLLFGKKNVLHFQVPFHNCNGGSIANQLKLRAIDKVITNSNFTHEVIKKEFKVASDILHPPATMITPTDKQNLILAVGRFDNLMNAKRQDVLIKAFKRLNLADWRLVLAGGSLHGEDHLKSLRQLAANNSAIEIVVNPDFSIIQEYYSSAKLFWHAAGYGLDLDSFPEKAEHFGISTVEAMSAGAVPLVFRGGGQIEIVDQAHTGYLWDDISELKHLTLELIKHPDKMKQMSLNAMTKARQFSLEAFEQKLLTLIS